LVCSEFPHLFALLPWQTPVFTPAQFSISLVSCLLSIESAELQMAASPQQLHLPEVCVLLTDTLK